jgi:hypothetical protein
LLLLPHLLPEHASLYLGVDPLRWRKGGKCHLKVEMKKMEPSITKKKKCMYE